MSNIKIFTILIFIHFTSLLLAETHYETLGIKSTATHSEIKKAYKRKMAKLHPDIILRLKLNEQARKEEEKKTEGDLIKVQEAYKILSNPTKRIKYDNTIGGTYLTTEEDILTEPEYFSSENPVGKANLTEILCKLGECLSQQDINDPLAEKLNLINNKIKSFSENSNIKQNSKQNSLIYIFTDEELRFIISLFEDQPTHSTTWDALNTLLFNCQNWPHEIWDEIEKNYTHLRSGGKLFPLVDAIRNQQYWPPSFKQRVENSLDPGLIVFSEANPGGFSQNLRTAALEMLLQRTDNPPIEKMKSVVESFLLSHHNSRLFEYAKSILLEEPRLESQTIDERLTQTMHNIFYNDPKQIPSRGGYPHSIVQIFLQRRKMPEQVWNMLSDEIDKGETTELAYWTIWQLSLIFKVPPPLSQKFFELSIDLYSESFDHLIYESLSSNRNTYAERNFGIKVEPNNRLDTFDCISSACLYELTTLLKNYFYKNKNYQKVLKSILIEKIINIINTDKVILNDHKLFKHLKNTVEYFDDYKAQSYHFKELESEFKELRNILNTDENTTNQKNESAQSNIDQLQTQNTETVQNKPRLKTKIIHFWNHIMNKSNSLLRCDDVFRALK